MKKFESPQEEALEIAVATRKKILNKEEEIVSVLRNCLVVAVNLSKEEKIEWLKGELKGNFKITPKSRRISCIYEKEGRKFEKLRSFDIELEMGLIKYYFDNNKNLRYVIPKKKGNYCNS